MSIAIFCFRVWIQVLCMLPVFDPCQSCCIGVVECSAISRTDLLLKLNWFNTALEKEGLKTFDARDRHKTIPGLEHAKIEIDDALKIICHSHGLAFADVWIAYKDENQVSSSSLEDGQAKRVIGLKLTDNVDDEDFESYHCSGYRLPLKMGEGLIGKTFQNYKPCYTEDIWELRSTNTGDLDYIFKFYWTNDRDRVILLESLLLKFKRCLPSFKLESGVELGDEIDILDARDSTENENKYLKIFQRKTSLKRGRQSKAEECVTPLKARGKTTRIDLSREEIEAQFGQTQEIAAKNLIVHPSTLKRNCVRLGIRWQGIYSVKKNESDMNDGGAIQDNTGEASLDKNMVTIKAEYADDVILFTHPISSATSKAMEKEIVKRYELDPATRYKLKYLDVENDEWILCACDENVTLFQKDKRNVRLRLLTRDPPHT